MSNETSEIILVTPEEAGLRLDKLLTSRFPDYSRTYFQFLIEEGGVLVSGQVLKKRESPKVGDEIEICFALTPELSLKPENIPLNILFEDEHLLIIDKPAGLVVHPAPGHPSGTFANALIYYCQTIRPTNESDLRPGIVHRLDKDTSGVLIAAKTSQAHQKLVSLFATRQVEKHYVAVCIGAPKVSRIDAPIGRHHKYRQEMGVCEERGKEAITLCRVIAQEGPLALVALQILTGRTHQIRVHMKHIGSPVLGDPVYGSKQQNEKYGASRQLLHAHRIKFIHPFTSAVVEVESPIPTEVSARFISPLSVSSNIN
ncbi:MAG: RluA family pseudouridine synthase [Chlamydiales bacterium]|nr:RluA family pseudouridine synthase [Chlamydiales bacterium]